MVVDRAETHFREADAVMQSSPRWTVRAPRVMREAYRSILDGLVARGWSPPRPPVRLSRARLAWILLRYAVF